MTLTAAESDVLRFRGRSVPPWRHVLRRDRCAYCGGPGGTIDHIEPTVASGSNLIENLTGACTRCNSRKAGWSLLLFMLREARIQDFRVCDRSFASGGLTMREQLADLVRSDTMEAA